MAGCYHWLDGHESQWTPGVGDGQGGLACCNSWDHKELDTTEQLNWTELNIKRSFIYANLIMVYLWKTIQQWVFSPLTNSPSFPDKSLTIWIDILPALFLPTLCHPSKYENFILWYKTIYTMSIFYWHKLIPVPRIPFLVYLCFPTHPIYHSE